MIDRGAFVAGVIGIPASWSVGLDSDLRTGFACKARVLETLGQAMFNVRMLGSTVWWSSSTSPGTSQPAWRSWRRGGRQGHDLRWQRLPCAASAYVAGGVEVHRWLLDLVRWPGRGA